MSQEVNMKLNVDSKQAQKNVGAVNEKLKETSKESKKVSTDVSEMGNQLDNVTGGAVSGFQGLVGTLKRSLEASEHSKVCFYLLELVQLLLLWEL